MKALFSKIMVLLFVFTQITVHSQENNPKAQKKAEKQKQLETLLESREFVFTAETASPQGMTTVTLTSSNNSLKVHPKTMECQLPYFGRAYSGMPYGGDYGIQFNAEPTDYKLTKQKKNYEILATVKANNDTYKLTLNVGLDGYATLHVYTNKKSSISYYGTILPPENNIEDK